MTTPNRKSRLAPLTGTLTGALLLTGALFLPGARAQTGPDTTAPTTPTDIAPAPPVLTAPPDTTTPPPPPIDTASPTTAPTPAAPETTTAPPSPASAPSPEDDHKSSRFRIGPTIGFFLPSDSKTRDRFGSSWFSIGLGLGPVTGISEAGAIGFDINLLYQQHDGNHALIVPIGVGYRRALVRTRNADGTPDPTVKTVPYVGVTADYYLVNFKSNPENINGTYGAGGGSVLLGVNFGDSANLEARYQFTSKVRGFDFSGLNLTAGYRF